MRVRKLDRVVYFLLFGQQYEIIESDVAELGPWKVSTRAYEYRIEAADRAELATWHWHPEGVSTFIRPHVHVGGPLAGCHIPTGRVSVESVVRFLVLELGVRTLRGDAGTVLDEGEARFEDWRTWA